MGRDERLKRREAATAAIVAGPHGWISWKSTEVSMTVRCTCGELSHVDADFCYMIRCGGCGQLYEVAEEVALVPVLEGEEDENDHAPWVSRTISEVVNDSRRMLRGAAPSEWRKPYRIILGAGGIALQAAPGIWPDSAARTTPMPDDPLARAFRALRSCGVPVAEGSCRYSADGTAIEYDFLPD